MRTIDADALIEKCGDWYVEEGPEIGFIGTLKGLIDQQPTIQPDAPRVMTLRELDDLRGRGRAVWFEDRDASAKCQDVFFVVANDLYADLRGETYSMFQMTNGYGVDWRCWTSRPTDEQREAVEWNDPGEEDEENNPSGADVPPPLSGEALGCETCRHHLGAGVCAVSLEMECRDGNYEEWEEKNHGGNDGCKDVGTGTDAHEHDVQGQDGP